MEGDAQSVPRQLAEDFVGRWQSHYAHLADDYPAWSTHKRPRGVDGLHWLGIRLLESHFQDWAGEIVEATHREYLSQYEDWTVLAHEGRLYLVPEHREEGRARSILFGGSQSYGIGTRESAPYHALYQALRVILPREPSLLETIRERDLTERFLSALPSTVDKPDQETVRALLFRRSESWPLGAFHELSRLCQRWRQAPTRRRRSEPRDSYRDAARRLFAELGRDEMAGKATLAAIGLGEVSSRRASARPLTDLHDDDLLDLFKETRRLVNEVRSFDARLANVAHQEYLRDSWALVRGTPYPADLSRRREDERLNKLREAKYRNFLLWCLRLRFPVLVRTEIEASIAPFRPRGRIHATHSLLLLRLGLPESDRTALKDLIYNAARR